MWMCESLASSTSSRNFADCEICIVVSTRHVDVDARLAESTLLFGPLSPPFAQAIVSFITAYTRMFVDTLVRAYSFTYLCAEYYTRLTALPLRKTANGKIVAAFQYLDRLLCERLFWSNSLCLVGAFDFVFRFRVDLETFGAHSEL